MLLKISYKHQSRSCDIQLHCIAPSDRVGANNVIITTGTLASSLVTHHVSVFRMEDIPVRLLARHLRRKLLLACELSALAVPSVLLIDDLPLEDLDTVNHIKELSRRGTSVVCSMQSCSLRILEKFDKVLIIFRKNIIFNGSVTGLWNI